jgi:hypothetical protein
MFWVVRKTRVKVLRLSKIAQPLASIPGVGESDSKPSKRDLGKGGCALRKSGVGVVQ